MLLSTLQFGETAADKVSCGSAAALDNLATGSVLVAIRPNSVSNVARGFVSKQTNTPSSLGWVLQQRAADGTTFTGVVRRATTNQSVICPASTLKVGVWQWIGFTWNMSGTPAAYFALDGYPLADVSTSATAGSGTQTDDSANNLLLGQALDIASPTNSMNGSMAVAMLWSRQLGLYELIQAQFGLINGSGLLGVWFPGQHGTSVVIDGSGNGNHGAVTGAVPSGLMLTFGVRLGTNPARNLAVLIPQWATTAGHPLLPKPADPWKVVSY